MQRMRWCAGTIFPGQNNFYGVITKYRKNTK